MDPVRVGVLGAGRIGRLHAENLARLVPGARVVAVADARMEAAREAAAACPEARAVEDSLRLVEASDLDAVVIASPTATHAPLLEAAAAAGKHVFCEKPIDLDLPRARAAVAAAERAGILLQIGFNRRFDPAFRRTAASVHAGEIGEVHLVRITSRDPSPPPADYVRTSGGLFFDMAIHDLDMARFVSGCDVESVYADASVLADPEIGRAGDVDTAAITLRLTGGALVLIDNSRRAVYGYDQRVEVFGARGCLAAGNRTLTTVERWDHAGQHREPPLPFFLERYRESYVLELSAFVDCVHARRAPEPGGADGLRALELAACARRSLAERRPVRVDEVAVRSRAA